MLCLLLKNSIIFIDKIIFGLEYYFIFYFFLITLLNLSLFSFSKFFCKTFYQIVTTFLFAIIQRKIDNLFWFIKWEWVSNPSIINCLAAYIYVLIFYYFKEILFLLDGNCILYLYYRYYLYFNYFSFEKKILLVKTIYKTRIQTW